jgi:2-amino-4-hydroxy-6-hydroxymethyldihydropteridine diphosphokinase
VGSNLGDRGHFLEAAKNRVKKIQGTRFLNSSSVLETDPVGGPPQGKFLNAVWEIETALSPQKLREELYQIEAELGRKHTVRNAPREIDLDILFFGERVLKEAGLEIPHPRLHKRPFVLVPLCEIAPGKIHPILKKSVREFLEKLHRQKGTGL